MSRALSRSLTVALVLSASFALGHPGHALGGRSDKGSGAKQIAASAATSTVRAPSPVVGEVYPLGRTLSPMTRSVAQRIRAIAARNDGLHDDRFSKVGASATVNRNFLRCFSGSHVDLGAHGELAEALAHFNGASRDPFRRQSESATVGWHAGRAIWGNPSPLALEIRAFDPRFALVMYGTNDLELNRPALYARLMLRLTNMLIVRGVVPLMSTIMPRDDDAEADRYVTLYNAVVRAVAQMQRVPMVDYHRELARLEGHALASDGVHPNVHFVSGDPRGCDFSPEGLTHGYNVRNLLALQSLDRAWRALEGRPPIEAATERPGGSGTFGDPIVIEELPFSSAGDTERSISDARDSYEACGDQDEGGPEVVYKLHLEEESTIYALATSTHGVDVDLHVLRDGECVERADEGLEVLLPAGDHLLVVDTFQRGDDAQAGRYALAVARTDLPSDREGT